MEKGAILVGEPMGLFIAQEEGELSDVSGYSMAVAGAEFNVAVGLARLNPLSYFHAPCPEFSYSRALLHASQADSRCRFQSRKASQKYIPDYTLRPSQSLLQKEGKSHFRH